MFQQFRDCLFILDGRVRMQFAVLGLMMIFGALLESLSVGQSLCHTNAQRADAREPRQNGLFGLVMIEVGSLRQITA